MGWGGCLGPQRGLDLLAGPPGPAYAIEAFWVLAKICVKVLALCWVSKVQLGVRLKKLPLPHESSVGWQHFLQLSLHSAPLSHESHWLCQSSLTPTPTERGQKSQGGVLSSPFPTLCEALASSSEQWGREYPRRRAAERIKHIHFQSTSQHIVGAQEMMFFPVC